MKFHLSTFNFDKMKKLIAKAITFVLLIMIFQMVIFFGNLYLDFPELRTLNAFLNKKTDIIFFGDSVMNAFEDNEDDKRPFPEFLQDEIKQLTIGPVHHPAYHTEVYLEYCKYIVQQENKPKAILIPINMRSFSPDWHGRPEYEFGKKIKYLKSNLWSAFQDPINVFTKMEISSSFEEFTQVPVFKGDNKVGIVKDYIGEQYRTVSEENTRKKIIFHYMYSLDKNHDKLEAIRQITTMLNTADIKPIFYITPLDYGFCETYFPNEFTHRMKKNVGVITAELTGLNAILLDYSDLLRTTEFSWRQDKYPNEHLNKKGKKKLAISLAKEINALKL